MLTLNSNDKIRLNQIIIINEGVMRIKTLMSLIMTSMPMLSFADVAVSESSVATPAEIKKEKRLIYNSAESNDFTIDQCARDEDGVCITTAYHDKYISPNNYIQDPYNHMLTAGGRHMVSESDVSNKGLWEQFFTNGTYNAQVGATWAILNVPNNNYAYGGSLFMQSGHVGGFALGGTLEVVNPFLQPGMRYLSGDISYYMLPNSQVVTPSQLYVEYQLADKVQVDAGWIILTTPWMNSYDDAMLVTAPYQGALVNYQISNNWRLTGIATNAFEPMGSTSFGQDTMYNQSYGNYVTRSPYNGQQQIFTDNYTSGGSMALGAIFHPSDNYKLNMWAYSFSGYANTLYADSEYEFHLNPINKFNLGVQIGNQNTWGMATTTPQVVGDGAVNSYLMGAKFGYSFDDWLNAEISYDTMFGPQNSFYNGGFISPYTFTIVNDPLYTSGLGAGMIEQGAGNSYRGALIFKPIPGDSRTKIEIAYEQFNTVNPMQEFDVDLKWVPNGAPKGLIVHVQGDYAISPATNFVDGGNFFYFQTMVTYTY